MARCESPIEAHLLTALVAEAVHQLGYPPILGSVLPPDVWHRKQILILQQEPVSGYRVDFMVCALRPVDDSRGHSVVMGWVAVECDGHDYHERTKEQASRDKKRDRLLQTDGNAVFRYSGSDIWNGSVGIAKEAIEMAARLAESAQAAELLRAPAKWQ